ncbi:hypothetical protein IFM89_036486, partial [Coptis chinensis]
RYSLPAGLACLPILSHLKRSMGNVVFYIYNSAYMNLTVSIFAIAEFTPLKQWGTNVVRIDLRGDFRVQWKN